MQVPVGKQHAPVAAGRHVVDEQTVPAPWNIPPIMWHCIWVSTEHCPEGRQHAPDGVTEQLTAGQVELSP